MERRLRLGFSICIFILTYRPELWPRHNRFWTWGWPLWRWRGTECPRPSRPRSSTSPCRSRCRSLRTRLSWHWGYTESDHPFPEMKRITIKIYWKNSYHKIEPTCPPLDTARISPFVVCLRAIFCTWRADNTKSWQTQKNKERPLLNKNADLSGVISDAF